MKEQNDSSSSNIPCLVGVAGPSPASVGTLEINSKMLRDYFLEDHETRSFIDMDYPNTVKNSIIRKAVQFLHHKKIDPISHDHKKALANAVISLFKNIGEFQPILISIVNKIKNNSVKMRSLVPARKDSGKYIIY